MSLVDLVMPKLGESIMEATILKWHKQPGDPVQQDETVLEIATDKVDSEVPSTTAGVVEEILFNVNDVVPIGTVIAKIRSDTEQANPGTPAATSPQIMQENAYRQAGSGNGHHQAEHKQTNKFYSPLVLNIAASEGVSLSELEKIPGTGNEGRVTKKDILEYVAKGKEQGTRYSSQEVTIL